MSIKFFLGLAVAIAPLSAAGAALVNGTFEAGSTGWTVDIGRVDFLMGSIYADGIGTVATPAQRANTYAFFGGADVSGPNVLSQSFATVSGTRYNFSFDSASVGGFFPQVINYNFGGTIGSTIYSPSNNFGVFQTYTGSFVASSTQSTVSLVNISVGGDGSDLWVDNVSVAAVPEPQTWAMLIAGFGLVGGVSRRRRMATQA